MSKITNKPIILVDGSSYLYRAFHAMPSFTNSKQFPTGAIYGVVNMLKKLLSDYDPEFIAVVFDAKGKTFRDAMYDQYKANRKEMPTDLVKQIDHIHAAVRALGLPILMVDGVEADDVIGTLAKTAAREKKSILISTGDKDLAQLVDEHITLVNTMTDTYLNPITVKEKFGIPPELIVDYLALVGDSVDNIPGVAGVGPKTAVKWLIEYGSLENVVKQANTVKGKVGDNLRAALPTIPLAKQLATIKLDVALDVELAALKRQAHNNDTLRKLYQELEFKTWLAELLENDTGNPDAAIQKHEKYALITTGVDLEKLIKALQISPIFALNVETTTGLNYMDARIVGLAFALEPGKAAYIPLAHDDDGAPQQLERAATLKKLQPILENPALKKIGHNLKFFVEALANDNIELRGIAYDTMLESYVLDSSSNKHDLGSLALKYLGQRTIHFEDIAGKGAKQISFNQVPVATAATYAAEIADVTLQLHHVFWPKLSAEPGMKNIFEKIEIPLLTVLASVERNGVLIDALKLQAQSHELEKRLIELENAAFAIAGGPFNLNSPKQLQEILFGKLQLPVLQKTPTGQPSTADAVLQELALNYPLPQQIIEYRSLSKLISTYTRRLPEQINASTGRIHTSYNQTVTVTGRLSSSDPNLQNIPVRTTEGRRIRQAFIARKGYQIVSADYSQIELRIMSHISQDPALLGAFERNLDIHQATAAEVLELKLEDVTSEQRRSAKAINFGLIYGMSSFGLAAQLGVDRNTAQDYINLYFKRYPQVKNYMDNTRIQAHAQGYVETLSGRRLYLPDINSSQIMRQKGAERAAINAPLQGTAADIIKRAMINIKRWLDENAIDARMIMQVHDELVFEVAAGQIDTVMDGIRQHMMQAAELKIPLLVSMASGENWDAASAH